MKLPRDLRRCAGVALVALCAAAPAFAVKEIAQPAAVKKAFERNPSALNGARFFAAPGGLIGVVTLPPAPAKPAVLYVAADGSAIFVGMVVDVATGNNLTAEAATQLAPGSPVAKAAEQLVASARQAAPAPGAEPEDPIPAASTTAATLAGLGYVETGSGDRVIYALVDPLCKHCKNAFNEITAWQKAGGKTRVRWVPISFGNPVATTRAAQALGTRTSSGLAAMFSDAAPIPEQVTKGSLLLEKNVAFIESDLPITATPVFVYTDGGKVTAKTGYGGIVGFAGAGKAQ